MPATYEDIEIESGATWEREWSVVDEDGVAAVLTGFTAQLDFKHSADDAAALLSLSTDDDSLTIIAATGIIIGRIEQAVTAVLGWRTAVYDLRITDGTDAWRVVGGAAKVSPAVTRI